MNLPIRVRLTAWHGLLLAATIVVLSAFLVIRMEVSLRRELDGEVRVASMELRRALVEDEEDRLDAQPVRRQERDFIAAADVILPHSGAGAQLLDAQGRVVLHYGDLGAGPPLVAADEPQSAEVTTATRRADGVDLRVRAVPVSVRGAPRVLVVARSLRPIEEDVARVRDILLVTGPACLLLMTLAGFWLVSRALRPVGVMTRDAREITIERLHERVAVPPSRDETQRLALTLNQMLDRIEQGVREKHQVVADASHELRTPLAVMRSELDVTLRGKGLSDSERDVLVSVREEVDRITRTVDNLLTSAQVDEGRLELFAVPVDLRQLVEQVVNRLRAVGAAKDVTLSVDGNSWHGYIDAQRVSLAVTNLVENAIKYSPTGGHVAVELWERDGEAGLTVSDQGPGIPPKDREHVFDRFYQVEGSWRQGVGGSGLGLAICREIAVAHGGRIWVESGKDHGAAFSLALPGWRSEAPEPDPESRTAPT